MQNTTLPTLSLDAGGHWELILPAAILPAAIATVNVSEDGIYLETVDGSYDLLTWDDLLTVSIPGRLGQVLASNNGRVQWPNPRIYLVDDSMGVIPMH